MEKVDQEKIEPEQSKDNFEGFETLPDEVKDFLKYHGPQLISNGFPMKKELVENLYKKLKESIYDAEDRNRELYCLQAINSIAKEEDVYIIDHFFSFRYEELRKKVSSEKNLRQRLNKMLKFWREKKSLRDVEVRPNNATDPKIHPEFDYQEIDDIRNLDIDWENVVTLSLCGCNITNPDVIAVMLPKMPKLKAIWINDNPCVQTEENKKLFRVYVENHHSGVEIVNSKFTRNTKEWGILFSTFGGNMQMIESYDINELVMVDISDRDFGNMGDNIEILYNLPKVTHVKCYGTAFNSYGETNRFLNMIKAMKNLRYFEMDYYLLDLFWKIKDRIKILNSNLKYINGYDLGFSQPKEHDEETDFVVRNIWKVLGSYRIATTGDMADKLPIFYVQDEVGNAIVHSSEPNVRNLPFLWFPFNDPFKGCKAVNFFWPIRDINEAEFITTDKLFGLSDNLKYAKEGLWEIVDTEIFIKAYEERKKRLSETKIKGEEIIAQGMEQACKPEPIPSIYKGDKLKYASDVKNLKELLTLEEFEYTEDPEEADIIWMNNNLKYSNLPEEKLKKTYKNQIPYEGCLADKGFFLETITSQYGQPDWLTVSYSLNNEMSAFVGEYLTRKSNFLPNFWITKPVRSTRGAEMAITDDLDLIIKAPETGPKIVSKYVENPLRFRGSKFDMRYFVLIRSIEPLEVYVHDIFLINVSRNDFTLDKRRLFQYDTHFTLNYGKKQKGLEIKWFEFIEQFEQKHKDIKFDEIRERVNKMLAEAIILAKSKYPNMQSEFARGFYGIDTILDENFNLQLFEFTFAPDCTRPGLYSKTFWNEIFGCMFLGKVENMKRIL